MEQQQADSGELVAALKDVSTQLRSVRDTFTSAHFEPVVNALNDVKGVLGNIENHMNNVENHMENVQKHMRNTKDDVADLRKEFVGTRAKMNHDAAM
jgi:methyl-accepting chemotaxis protein